METTTDATTEPVPTTTETVPLMERTVNIAGIRQQIEAEMAKWAWIPLAFVFITIGLIRPMWGGDADVQSISAKVSAIFCVLMAIWARLERPSNDHQD